VTSTPEDRDDRIDPSKSEASDQSRARARNTGQAPGGGQYARDDEVQGEGNYEAAREYDEAQRKFVESGRVDAAARAAAPKSPQEEREMEEAEREGKSHRKSDER
jgi:hypothetical protein